MKSPAYPGQAVRFYILAKIKKLMAVTAIERL